MHKRMCIIVLKKPNIHHKHDAVILNRITAFFCSTKIKAIVADIIFFAIYCHFLSFKGTKGIFWPKKRYFIYKNSFLCKIMEIWRLTMSEDIKHHFSVFIKKVLVNEWNNYLKKINRRKNEILSEFQEKEFVPEALTHRDTHSFIENDIANRILNNLKESDREILVLRVICGYSEREVAQMLNIKIASVQKKLYRAKQRIRKIFEEEGYDERF